jgi:hypothetical protein
LKKEYVLSRSEKRRGGKIKMPRPIRHTYPTIPYFRALKTQVMGEISFQRVLEKYREHSFSQKDKGERFLVQVHTHS